VAIFAAGLLCYVVLLAALPLSHVMGDRGRAVFSKIMALLLGAIGIQFIINGVRPILTDILKAA
jgi:small neutral amino acid transporter SnatA (MarC family)